jgi:uncharacterized coiled-coil protein SlyX
MSAEPRQSDKLYHPCFRAMIDEYLKRFAVEVPAVYDDLFVISALTPFVDGQLQAPVRDIERAHLWLQSKTIEKLNAKVATLEKEVEHSKRLRASEQELEIDPYAPSYARTCQYSGDGGGN